MGRVRRPWYIGASGFARWSFGCSDRYRGSWQHATLIKGGGVVPEVLQFGLFVAVGLGLLAFCCRGPKSVKERLIVGGIYLAVGFAAGIFIWWIVDAINVAGQWLRR